MLVIAHVFYVYEYYDYFTTSAPEQAASIELTDSGTTFLQVSWSQGQTTGQAVFYEVKLLNPLDSSSIQGPFTIDE